MAGGLPRATNDGLPLVVTIVERARSRLRLRQVLRDGAVGLWSGLGVAFTLVVLSRFVWPFPVGVAWTLGPLVGIGALVGSAIGATRRGLTPREIALLLDRKLGTNELLVTAIHLRNGDHPARAAIADELDRRLGRALPSLREEIPLLWPRHLRWSPLLVLAVIGMLFVPARVRPDARSDGGLASEGQRLAERLEKVEKELDIELPPTLEQNLEDLVADMKNEDITPQEAMERLDKLEEELAKQSEKLESSARVADQLEDAARTLSTSAAAEKLADALEKQDMEAASAAVKEMSDAIGEMSPEERKQLGEGLREAAEQMAKDPKMQDLAKAMKQAGESTGQSGEGQPGGESGGQDGMQALEALSKELERSQSLAQQARQDRELLERSQELNGALEGSKQRLEKAQQAEAGQTSESAGQGGQPGEGKGEKAETTADYGTGHTWQDEGVTNGPLGPHGDKDRQSSRQGGNTVDDFQELYAPLRLQGTQGILAGVDGHVDPNGASDLVPLRLTGGDERADETLLDVPEQYRDAADQALSNEQIPPGYRDAVKTYFGSME